MSLFYLNFNELFYPRKNPYCNKIVSLPVNFYEQRIIAGGYLSSSLLHHAKLSYFSGQYKMIKMGLSSFLFHFFICYWL
jgi:predicted DNA-binding helix-hairpin-helix protein